MKIADKISKKYIYIVGIFLNLISLMVWILYPSFLLISISCFLCGIGKALQSGILESWLVNQIKKIDPADKLENVFRYNSIISSLSIPFGVITSSLLESPLIQTELQQLNRRYKSNNAHFH